MILGILQARSSSTRLPHKVMMRVMGKPLLSLQIERALRSISMDRLVVATSTEKADDEIEILCGDLGIVCCRGSLDDVLDRFYQTSRLHMPKHIVRLTGDCPLIDPEVIDDVIKYYQEHGFDYVSNALIPSFPDGLDVEVFSFQALEAAWKEAVLPSHREHVTLFINQHPDRFKIGNFLHKGDDLSHLRWTVDEPEDFELVSIIYKALYPQRPAFTTADILELLHKQPSLADINSRFTRNEGLIKSLEKDKLKSANSHGSQ